MKKIKCPYCGYEMPFFYNKNSLCIGVTAKCKGRNCGKIFPICIGMESEKLRKNGIVSDQFEI